MTPFDQKLNNLLVQTYNSIQKMEEASLNAMNRYRLSISEYHMMDSVYCGGEQGRTVTDIAHDLGISTASVTVGLNKMTAKGYVEKRKSDTDGRVTYVYLTRLGQKLNAGHRYFHERMVRYASEGFSTEELNVLARCLVRLNQFLDASPSMQLRKDLAGAKEKEQS